MKFDSKIWWALKNIMLTLDLSSSRQNLFNFDIDKFNTEGLEREVRTAVLFKLEKEGLITIIRENKVDIRAFEPEDPHLTMRQTYSALGPNTDEPIYKVISYTISIKVEPFMRLYQECSDHFGGVDHEGLLIFRHEDLCMYYKPGRICSNKNIKERPIYGGTSEPRKIWDYARSHKKLTLSKKEIADALGRKNVNMEDFKEKIYNHRKGLIAHILKEAAEHNISEDFLKQHLLMFRGDKLHIFAP